MKITPDKENPNRCLAERTVQVDPKGMIPVCLFISFALFSHFLPKGWVVNMNKGKSGNRMMKIR